MTQKPITLTLQSGASVLVDKRERISHLLFHFIHNPGRASQLFESELLSLSDISSKYISAPTELCAQIAGALQNRINQYFAIDSNDNLTVTCEWEQHPDSAFFDIHLAVTGTYIDESGTTVTYEQKFLFEQTSENKIRLKIQGTEL